MGKYLIGIDEGTTGCRTCIFDTEGNLVGSDYREYACYYPKPGWVEQIPEDITPALFNSCKDAIANAKIDPKEIIALGLSSQGSVTGPVDKNGKLLRPFIGWQDLRGHELKQDVESKISREDFYKITGDPYLGVNFSINKYLWIRKNQPEIYEKTAMFTTHQDYFMREFGAEGYWTDLSSSSRTAMMDVDHHVWSQKIMDLFDFDISQHPKLAEGGQVIGTVPKHVAEKTGLPEGTPLCVGAHDQNCSTFGCGAVEDGSCAMVLGTFGSCFVVSDKPIRDPNLALVVKGNVGPKNWTIEAFANAAASSFRWYRDTFCELEKAAGKVLGEDAYKLIDQEIQKAPAGAHGVTFLSYLQGAGGPRANNKATGTFIGMTLGTSQADMARAVMEGISYEMRDIIEAQKRAGTKINAIRLTGGGSKSPLWVQMQADIYQQPIHVLQTHETGALGAALYAGVGAKVYKSYKEAVDVAVHVTREFTPNPKMSSVYDDAYGRFVHTYQALAAGGVF